MRWKQISSNLFQLVNCWNGPSNPLSTLSLSACWVQISLRLRWSGLMSFFKRRSETTLCSHECRSVSASLQLKIQLIVSLGHNLSNYKCMQKIGRLTYFLSSCTAVVATHVPWRFPPELSMTNTFSDARQFFSHLCCKSLVPDLAPSHVELQLGSGVVHVPHPKSAWLGFCFILFYLFFYFSFSAYPQAMSCSWQWVQLATRFLSTLEEATLVLPFCEQILQDEDIIRRRHCRSARVRAEGHSVRCLNGAGSTQTSECSEASSERPM